MTKNSLFWLLFSTSLLMTAGYASAQNPIVRDQFSADPTARLFNGRVYVFPSHDIVARPGQGRPNWFCMEDYHVFSSANLTDWTDHGVIVTQKDVPWVDSTTYSMWAPDCFFRNGKYYFYFPATAKASYARGYAVGVAIADKPEGPYTPQPAPIANVRGIDPNVLLDKDGQAYLYWSQGSIFGAKLKANMLELDSEVQVMADLPKVGLIEGPFVFERNGIYYMTYPHVQNKIERLEYAIGDNPLGPFKFAGVIMDESPLNCWTNHHSLLEVNGQWFLFYHQNELSPKFDKNRSICVDSLSFNADGTIRKVIPTRRGVGVTPATKTIELDRYSHLSPAGASIAFLDSLNTFKGWKTVLQRKDAWAQYNTVDFGSKNLKTVQVRALSPSGGTLRLSLDGVSGPVIADVSVPKGTEWRTVEARVSGNNTGIHHLLVTLGDGSPVEIDWISFK
jgi:hypothetical protein